MKHPVSRNVRWFMLASLVCLAGTAMGQAAEQPAGAQPSAAAPAAAPAALQRATADALMRLAFFDLRIRPEPGADDYALASGLLRSASVFAPEDLELARRLVETGWGAGDEAQVLNATRRIVRLDPKDTVAQLRLISALLGPFQTAGDRMARYDEFLGKKGEALDPAVRSRLALDAALLSRERSDEKGFIDRLKMAVRLDPTNKDAALLAYNFYCERVNNPTGRLELLANLLYSDPMDPNVHLMMAGELASQGAFVQARRFHSIGLGVFAVSGDPLPAGSRVEVLILDWLNDGPSKPADLINRMLEAQRTEVARQRRNLFEDKSQAAVDALSSSAKPEDVRLSDAGQEAVRTCTAWILGNQTVLANSMGDLEATLRGEIVFLEAPNSRPRGMTDAQAKASIQNILQDLCLWRLLTEYKVEAVQNDLENAIGGLEDSNPRKIAVQAWTAVRAGDAAGALTICDRDPDTADQWIALARAFATEMLGKKPEAAAMFEEVSRRAPLTVLGAVGLERAAMARGGKRTPGNEPGAQAADATAYVMKIPAWIDTMATNARAFQSVVVEPGPLRISPLDHATLKVRIRNTASIPMAVGSDKAINTRFLFIPDMQIGPVDRPKTSEPEVVDLGIRLRLMPGESMEATIWPEGGLVGWLAQNASAAPTRLRWRVLQGFVTRQGAKTSGVGSIELHVDYQGRDALQDSYLPPDSLVERINTSSDGTVHPLVIASRVALTAPSKEFGTAADAGKAAVANALAARYPAWSPTARMLAIASLPPAGQIPELKVFDDVVRAEKDKAVLMVAVVARAASPDDPILTSALESGDEELAKAASAQIERLRKGGAIYAQTGVTPLLGATAPAELTP